MYSPAIVERNLEVLAAKGITVQRRSVGDCRTASEEFKLLVDADGKLKRALTPGEISFMRSEAILSRVDFRYWAERYAFCSLDASLGQGLVGPISFFPSQERALDLIGKREEELWAAYDKHGFSEGILTVWHKARQLGATMLMRLISMHRMTSYKNTRLVAGSLDEEKVHELYTRDKIILDNLPYYLSPKIEFDVKDQHLSFETLKSRLIYQQANQQAGIGTGAQFDMFHFTELALWLWADRLKYDFFPAVPKSRYVFGAIESTANGRNNFWHEFSEAVRRREPGHDSWIYIFTPYYINEKKYRRAAPDDWTPGEVAQQHSDMVERTSPDIIGRTFHLSKDQLYWWETEREMYRKDGSLPIFLTNYCATPAESFQYGERTALPVETIEWMRSNALKGMPYVPTDIALRA